jgi:hypothetical protein
VLAVVFGRFDPHSWRSRPWYFWSGALLVLDIAGKGVAGRGRCFWAFLSSFLVFSFLVFGSWALLVRALLVRVLLVLGHCWSWSLLVVVLEVLD